MDKKITDKESIQLEFDFNYSYSSENMLSSDRTVIALNHRHEKIKKQHHKIAQIIKIDDCINIIKKKRETEIINFIVNNSKSF
ncbi:hypothetical protein [Chryseobacterium arthrosphaerae]|uniref:Uncharacterized protein n=1 Tax=Chryseobacterium arthrosphaerae TaxID=651561 RepID=A0A1B8ZSC7_9FLAO|nr:hypothetical protein [Chryseobacterium arthrosphaerae]OCA74489.1 hypothetical protein BBI00_09185 [Chryseobacterium arthrosphaerae]